MSQYSILFGALATAIGLIAYALYFRDIFAGKTKPHAFTWLVWGILTAIAFAAQISKGAGAGAWVMGISAAICFVIFFLALFKGTNVFPLFDWIAFFVAGVSLWLWWLTSDPTLSVILITITDAVGFLPTFRKAYAKPFEETATSFALNSLKFIPSLFALQTYTLATWLYPASLVVMNGAFAVMVWVRRRVVR